MLYAQASDPVYDFMKKFTGVSVQSEMHLFAKDTSLFEKLSENLKPVLLDLTMTI
jgi:hypothetical protein